MHIEFRHLRTIRAIHEAGGMTRAAERLNMTQSALSHQVKGLEAQAGVALFVRRSKPVRLSAAGLRLLRLAERVLPEIEAPSTDGLKLEKLVVPVTDEQVMEAIEGIAGQNKSYKDAAKTKKAAEITSLEEEKIMAYFAGGKLYATPDRTEPWL